MTSRFVLRADAGQELALRLGDAQLLEGVLDVFRNLVPGLALLLGRPDVVEDVVEVDARMRSRAPVRHRPLLESGRSAFRRKSSIHSGSFFIFEMSARRSRGQATLALEDVVFFVVKTVLVLGDFDLCDFWWCNHVGVSLLR